MSDERSMTDYVWYNENTDRFMKQDGSYLLPGQTVDDRVTIIAETAERILKKPGFAEKFKSYFKRGWYSLSTPIWCNFGTDRGLPISCYNSYCADAIDSLLGKTHAEVAMMSKNGGGTSIYLGDVRGRGADIQGGKNGKSFGSVHFANHYQSLIQTCSQGSTRRGNLAAYWPIDHPDIMEVLRIKTDGSPIQHIFHGVCVPDAWLEDMIAGNRAKRDIWAEVLRSRQNTGLPYILFIDTVNRTRPQWYKDQGLVIKSSNLCVTGNQRVVSSRGLKTARELFNEGGDLILFDNEKTVNASPMRLVERDVPVYRITLDNGMTHTVTSYHKVKIRVSASGYYLKTTDRECKDLRPGDLVAIQTTKGLFGNQNRPDEAFLLGLYHGDGTDAGSTSSIELWENDFDILEEVQESYTRVRDAVLGGIGQNGRPCNQAVFREANSGVSTVRKMRLCGTLLKNIGFSKGVIPDWLWESNEKTVWQYIRGLFITDGTVHMAQSAGQPIQLSLASSNKAFLQDVQIILANLGMKTSIRIIYDAGARLLPDGKGGKKYYQCQDCWRLIIGNKNDALEFERQTGFLSRKDITIEDKEFRDNTKKFYAVTSIEYVGCEDVYCCTVESNERHWICNGVVTHNCVETTPTSNEDESFVCDLSSLNVAKFDEWKQTDASGVMVYFLDAVMTEFIDKARNIPYMERAVRYAERHRSLGIGWFGWHHFLQSRMIPFESLEAKRLNTMVAHTIRIGVTWASESMASEYGEPEVTRGYGRRHALLQAIAPTTSSSFIIGQTSESIEPLTSNYEIKDLAKGKFTVINPYLTKVLHSYGKNNRGVLNSVLQHGGSVQHLDFLSENEKAVFKTFSEISQLEVVQQAAQRQQYIDQGQSLNVFLTPDVPAKEINALLLEGWRAGVKSFYYNKGFNAAQQFTRNVLSCSSCEA